MSARQELTIDAAREHGATVFMLTEIVPDQPTVEFWEPVAIGRATAEETARHLADQAGVEIDMPRGGKASATFKVRDTAFRLLDPEYHPPEFMQRTGGELTNDEILDVLRAASKKNPAMGARLNRKTI